MAIREMITGAEGDTPTTPTSSVGEVVYPPVRASEKRKKRYISFSHNHAW